MQALPMRPLTLRLLSVFVIITVLVGLTACNEQQPIANQPAITPGMKPGETPPPQPDRTTPIKP